MKLEVIEVGFVEFIPATLAEGVLYVSMTYGTTVHLCACGCGNKVVLPLSPAEWRLTYDGVAISLHPSVGNWEFPCQSHYWIRGNEISWAPQWTKRQIAAGRRRDLEDLEAYHAPAATRALPDEPSLTGQPAQRQSLTSRARRWLRLN